MIADLDETIKQLLVAEMPIKNGEIDVSFDQPKREWSARLTKPAVNFFLYDLRQNAQLRQFHWQRVPVENGRRNVAGKKRTPFRIDCHYMITTWAAEAEDEHRLLARTLLALFRYPKIPRDQLASKLRDQEFDVTSQLASHDKLTNVAEIWSALDNEIRPTVSYLLTLTMDPWTPVEEPIVRTFGMRTGWKDGANGGTPISTGQDNTLAFVAGTVRNKSDGHVPLPGVGVTVKGTGFSDTTDEEGRFKIRGLQPGQYTFVVSPDDGDAVEKDIDVSTDNGDYDIDV